MLFFMTLSGLVSCSLDSSTDLGGPTVDTNAIDTITLPPPKSVRVERAEIVHIDTVIKPVPPGDSIVIRGHVFRKNPLILDSLYLDTIVGGMLIRWDTVVGAVKYSVRVRDTLLGDIDERVVVGQEKYFGNQRVNAVYSVSVSSVVIGPKSKKDMVGKPQLASAPIILFEPEPPKKINVTVTNSMIRVSWPPSRQSAVNWYIVYLRDSLATILDSQRVDSSKTSTYFPTVGERSFKINIRSQNAIGMSRISRIYAYDGDSKKDNKYLLPYVYCSTYKPPEDYLDSLVDILVGIRGGIYAMGNIWADTVAKNDTIGKPVHEVVLSSFYLSAKEITNKQFSRFLNASAPDTVILDSVKTAKDTTVLMTVKKSSFLVFESVPDTLLHMRYTKDSGFVVDTAFLQHPVRCVTWPGAAIFCNWVTQSSAFPLEYCYQIDSTTKSIAFLSGRRGYRLPSEAEFEYAHSSAASSFSTKQRYPWGYENNDLNFASKLKGYKKTGSFKPYDGLYDMSGNVLEWCNDYYNSNFYNQCLTQKVVTNPLDTVSSAPLFVDAPHVARGGSYRQNAGENATYYRHKRLRSSIEDCGFRVCRSK